MPNAYIAVDLGAESGRVIVCVLDGGRLRLEEVHRFVHEPVWLPTGLHWNITAIWSEIVAGLRHAAQWAQQNNVRPVSIGVDTWGVDWALVDKSGELVGLPHAYRDPRSQAAYEQAIARLGTQRIYRTTGIQFMWINSLYSLHAHQLNAPSALNVADKLLFMPDLFHYWLSGKAVCEATIASTSQMVDCHTGDWARDLLSELKLPTHFLQPIVQPGTRVGTLREALAKETRLPSDLQVVTPGSHDTASAVAAVPAVETGGSVAAATEPPVATGSWCYLSSGTWSLLGAELPEPCVTSAAEEASFTNERGIGNTIRFLKNIAGLWLVQECRRDLARGGQEFDYAELTRLAKEAAPFTTLVNPNHKSFEAPGGMLEKIRDFAASTGQPVPRSPGQFIRCCLESLALAYREKLLAMEAIVDRTFDVIHVVGGGGKNTLLCQMTADATGRRVIVGPYEATAMGNALVQAMALGEVTDLAELRRVVARSSELATYEPSGAADWDAAFSQYRTIAQPR